MTRLLAHLRQQWMGAIALLLVLTGGTAYAANTVFSSDIVDGQVKVADIGQGAVATNEIVNGQVRAGDIGDGEVTTDELANGQVKAVDIGTGEVRGSEVLDDNLTGGDIAFNSLKGADVDEGSLAGGLIPGIATSGLIRSSGIVKTNDPEGGQGTVEPLITAGPFTIFGECIDLGASGRSATVKIYSSAGPWSFDADSDGGGERTENPAGAANFIGFLADAGFAVTEPALDAGDYAAATPSRMLTGEVLAGENIMGTDCVFGVTGIG